MILSNLPHDYFWRISYPLCRINLCGLRCVWRPKQASRGGGKADRLAETGPFPVRPLLLMTKSFEIVPDYWILSLCAETFLQIEFLVSLYWPCEWSISGMWGSFRVPFKFLSSLEECASRQGALGLKLWSGLWGCGSVPTYRPVPQINLEATTSRVIYVTFCVLNTLSIYLKIGILAGGVQLGPLGTAATNMPIVPAPGGDDEGGIGGMIIGRGNSSTRRKPAPVPLCPPQPPYAARTRTRAAAVGSHRLTAWATARPSFVQPLTSKDKFKYSGN
jgi:hypothetical protein